MACTSTLSDGRKGRQAMGGSIHKDASENNRKNVNQSVGCVPLGREKAAAPISGGGARSVVKKVEDAAQTISEPNGQDAGNNREQVGEERNEFGNDEAASPHHRHNTDPKTPSCVRLAGEVLGVAEDATYQARVSAFSTYRKAKNERTCGK